MKDTESFLPVSFSVCLATKIIENTAGVIIMELETNVHGIIVPHVPNLLEYEMDYKPSSVITHFSYKKGLTRLSRYGTIFACIYH